MQRSRQTIASVDQEIDTLYDEIDKLLELGDYSMIDHICVGMAIIADHMELDVLVAGLSVTLPVKKQCKGRGFLYQETERRLIAEDGEVAAYKTLVGLQ